MKHRNKKLLLAASVIALNNYAFIPQAQSATCSGNQTRTAQCLDYTGAVVSDRYCTSNGVKKPKLSQTCTYYCPPPPPSGYDSGGDGRTDADEDGVDDSNDQNDMDASIGAASDSGGGGDSSGPCFVTTATVDVMGEADDGKTLSSLRYLRDYYTIHHHRGAERIAIYYDVAPSIVHKINNLSNASDLWTSVYKDWISPIRDLVNSGELEKADRLYADMVLSLSFQYLMDDLNAEQKRKLFLHAFKIHKA